MTITFDYYLLLDSVRYLQLLLAC